MKIGFHKQGCRRINDCDAGANQTGIPTTMLRKCSIIAVVFLAGAPSVAAQDAVSPQTRWAQVAACAGEGSAESRHACVDSVLRAAGALDAATEAAVNRNNFGRSERAVAAPIPAPARAPTPALASAPASGPVVAPPAVATPSPAAPPPVTNGISTQVASARSINNRHLQVVTAEGAIWQQVDNNIIRRIPRAGESFDVRDGSLGSFRCTINGNTTFRCERRD